MRIIHTDIKIGVISIWLVMCVCGCRKFIEVKAPPTSINSASVYEDDNTAISVLTGLYENMIGYSDGTASAIDGMSSVCELSADNLSLFAGSSVMNVSFYQNDLKALLSKNPLFFWSVSYAQIYTANAAIEGLTTATKLTPLIKQRLLGEARFMRAFYFFNLVNLYGDVPLVLVTDYKVNATMGRTPKEKVYEQIIADLKDAQNSLSDDYIDGTLLSTSGERIRVNKAVATAMLARVYLYVGDNAHAEMESTKVIEDPSYTLVGLDSVFLKNSRETIWALQPTQLNVNTWEGNIFIIPSTGPDDRFHPFYLSDQLLSSFEDDDLRLNQWTRDVTASGITYYYPFKYRASSDAPSVTEYKMVMRLAEQYLIRAEARAKLDKLTGSNSAESDLNAIRARAGLVGTTATTQADLLDAILHERQVELFTEWGHRWLDLKRTGKIDEVMSVVCPLKGGTWEPYKALYPISQLEIDGNPGLKGQQNPGYTN